MKNFVHRLSDPRDPGYPFADTYICSTCNERLSIDATICKMCNKPIHGTILNQKTKPLIKSNKKSSSPSHNISHPPNSLNLFLYNFKSALSRFIILFIFFLLMLFTIILIDLNNIIILPNTDMIDKINWLVK